MSYEPISSKNVKVRKEHQCEWCGEPINKGDEAHYRAYRFEGDFNSSYSHPECRDAMNDVPIWDENDSFTLGQFKRGTFELK